MTAGLDSLERVEFDAGDFLFQEGDLSFHFYIIQKGEVEIFLKGKKPGDEIPLAVVGPNQPVGEFALVTKKPRSATARAKTTVSAIKVSEKGYKSLLQELPEWAIAVIESLIERLRQTDETLRKHKADNTVALALISQILNNR